jgi:hypothetical protein
MWYSPGMDSEQQTTTVEHEDKQSRKRPRGKPWPKGVSGNPLGRQVTSKRVATLYAELADDLGGEAALSVIDRVTLLQACRLLVRSERTQDGDLALRLSNASARLLAALRKYQRKHEPPEETMAEYLRSRYPKDEASE